MRNKRILYVTWGEVIVNNGIFKNQVLGQLSLLKQQNPDWDITLLCGVPVINWRAIKQPSAFRKALTDIREQCGQLGLNFICRMHVVPSPWFYTPSRYLRIYDCFQYGFIREVLKEKQPHVVHCRSYQASRLFLNARKRYGLKYKLLFDTRGNFPEEGLIKGLLKEPDYFFWKGLEKQMLADADYVVNVSPTFSRYIQKITDNHAIKTIYTSTNMQVFRRDAGLREQSRQKLNIPAGVKVLAYLGELSETGWHQPERLLAVYKAFKACLKNTRMLIVSLSPRELVTAFFTREGIPADEIIVVAGRNAAETCAYLNAADYSVLPYRNTSNKYEELLGYTMIGSKTGEYLAVGLPVIVNNRIGAAAEVVEEYAVGVNYESGSEECIAEKLLLLDKDQDIHEKCVNVASQLFDAAKIAKAYKQIYEQFDGQ